MILSFKQSILVLQGGWIGEVGSNGGGWDCVTVGVGGRATACRYGGLELIRLRVGGWVRGDGKGGTKAGPWISSCHNWIMGYHLLRWGEVRALFGACSAGDIQTSLRQKPLRPSTKPRAWHKWDVSAEPW